MTVGVWRSLVAHTLGVRVVAGSNPATPTKPRSSILLRVIYAIGATCYLAMASGDRKI
jgi:hypothetical protein